MTVQHAEMENSSRPSSRIVAATATTKTTMAVAADGGVRQQTTPENKNRTV